MDPAYEGAKCVQHPLEPAVSTCARCGNFMCALCSAGSERGLCPSCRALLGETSFPLSRDAWSFSALWDLAWARFKADWINLTVGVLIVFMVSGGVGAASQLFQVGAGEIFGKRSFAPIVVMIAFQVVSIVVQGLMQLGLTALMLDALHGRRTDLARIFGGFRLLGRYLLVLLVILVVAAPPIVLAGGLIAAAAFDRSDSTILAVGVVLAVLIALVAAFFIFLPLGFAVPELVVNPEARATQIVRNCFAIAKDNRWNMIGVGFMAGLVALVGVLACCIGFLPASALAQLLNLGLFLSLRNGSSVVSAPAREG